MALAADGCRAPSCMLFSTAAAAQEAACKERGDASLGPFEAPRGSTIWLPELFEGIRGSPAIEGKPESFGAVCSSSVLSDVGPRVSTVSTGNTVPFEGKGSPS
mmetsp:Transcript_3888/g.9303  ORF Transcript_3888/g.9303 Transcript_3888/m.9303 type:complete len:103 (+) Transcript_3888:211-519(+)